MMKSFDFLKFCFHVLARLIDESLSLIGGFIGAYTERNFDSNSDYTVERQ